MKKSKLFLTLLTVFCAGNAFAGLVKTYIVNQDFTGVTAAPSGWSMAADGTNYSLFYGGTADYGTTYANSLNLKGATLTKAQGIRATFPTSGTATQVYVEFDAVFNACGVDQKHALGIFLQESSATYANNSYASTGNILGLYVSGTDGYVHYQNIESSQAFGYSASNTGKFLRFGEDAATCNTNNAGTITTCPWAEGNTIHVKAILDFTNHNVTYLELTNGATVYTNSNTYSFINNTCSNVSKIAVTENQSTTSATNTNIPKAYNIGIKSLQTYTAVEAAASNVTINYLDTDGNPTGKSARVEADQQDGSTYTATSADKVAFSNGGYYYAYDATVTANNGGDNVVVASGGSSINLRFKKTALTAGSYSWTGLTSANWNDFDNNFSTDGTNSLNYQAGNALIFPETATNKTISIANSFNLGSGNITVSGSGYDFSGTGTLTGTGAFIVNPGAGNSTTLNIQNSLTGGVNVQSGTVIVKSTTSGNNYTLADGASIELNPEANFTKAITGTGTINIKTVANKYYSSTLTGPTTINLDLGVAGSLSSSNWTSQISTVMPSGAQLNVSTALGSAAYAVADASLTGVKVNLGDNVHLLKYYNQNSTTPYSNIVIGELSGSANSVLEGGFISGRTLNYTIGATNTDATFNGTIKNYGAGDILNIYKVGTGTWTLTGNNNAFLTGSFNVNAGSVVLNGSLAGASVPVTIASGATLAGTGSIAGATTVNGTLSGSLTFSGPVTIAASATIDANATVKLVTNSSTVATLALQDGVTIPNLTIVSTATPSAGTAIQVINATTPSSIIYTNTPIVPSGYSFNTTTGVLTYEVATEVSQPTTNISVYPSVTNGAVHIEGNDCVSAKVITLSGVVVTETQIANAAVINLQGFPAGIYLVKVLSADGSVSVHRVIYH